MKPVRVGLVGSQFVSTIHAEALKRVPVMGRATPWCPVCAPGREGLLELLKVDEVVDHLFRREMVEQAQRAL